MFDRLVAVDIDLVDFRESIEGRERNTTAVAIESVS